MDSNSPSKEFIDHICALYGDVYDDRIEDCRPPAAGSEFREAGSDWAPGKESDHKSLKAFQRQLEEEGISLSSTKIRKILITGGCWSTERSREVTSLFAKYTKPEEEGGLGLSEKDAKKRIADELGIYLSTVTINMPYQNVVYKLEKRSANAIRCARYKARKKAREEVN